MWNILFVLNAFFTPLLAQLPLPSVTLPPDDHICWDYGQAVPPAETFEEFIQSVSESRGVYTHFTVSPQMDFQRLDRGFFGGTFGVNMDEPIDLLLQLFTPELQPQRLRYLLILNEQQVTLPINGELVPYFDVTLNPAEMQTFTLTLPPLEAGLHDVTLIGINDIDVTSESTISTDGFNFRMTLIAGEESQALNLSEALVYTQFDVEERITQEGQQYYLTLTLSETTPFVWDFLEPLYSLESGQSLSFYALTGYRGASSDPALPASQLPPLPSSRFALLAFIDYVQVPILADQPVIYGEVTQKTLYTRIPITLDAPTESGHHELLIVQIAHPRVPVCVLVGPPDDYFIYPNGEHYRAAFEIVAESE